ncbi:MAG: HAMP domain-containing histidine kinase [Flavobacteriaceae bacterium]|nr:HAMP domain-containing histidine kinase [Flavobacteriaceae bacterium]
MNGLKYKSIIYFIAIVILATLCIQVYWNYKNYLVSKQQLMNDVQTSLDNAVDQYYTNLAVDNEYTFANDSVKISYGNRKFSAKKKWDSILHPNDPIFHSDSMRNGITIMKSNFKDSVELNLTFIDSLRTFSMGDNLMRIIDSAQNPISELSSKIIVSFSEDRLSLRKVDSLFSEELKRKNIKLEYGLSHSGLFQQNDSLRPKIISQATLETTSESPYFFHKNYLRAHFSNITLVLLKKNMIGILLSFLLVAGVIACLLYLLRIIKHQKQLAEVKNDLISNITHEFKTPIATIGIAMEAITNFDAAKDQEKNLRYAKISKEQVEKLNMMVEKLLETASLDSDELHLNYENIDLSEMLRKIATQENLSGLDKTIKYDGTSKEIYYPVDGFHFENAINNIVDNAIKYGGDTINIDLKEQKGNIIIEISDSGNSLTDQQQKQIFEKFYRVPKGNTHDVKGFGIGLYYTKKIIEKHGGNIEVNIRPNTRFIISLPYES